MLSLFDTITSKEELYQKIMELGRQLPPFESAWKVEENLVPGCQSIMHLKTTAREGHLFFYAHSDALISKGLAALMLAVYNDKTAEWVLKNPPTFLEKLGIIGLLSPSRSNGVLSLYHKMQKEALSYLTQGKDNAKLT